MTHVCNDNLSPPDKILRWPALLSEIPLGQNTIRDLIENGDFPKPIKLGPRTVGFLRSEIENWKSERIAARGAENE